MDDISFPQLSDDNNYIWLHFIAWGSKILKGIIFKPIFNVFAIAKSQVDSRGRLLTTILLPWQVPNHHILETLTSTDKLLRHVCSQSYLAGQVTWTEKKPNVQTVYSFGYQKHCQHLTIIKMQNVTYRFFWNSHYYWSYDFIIVITVNVYVRLQRRLSYVQFAKKIVTLPPFLKVSEIFLFNAWLGTGISFASAISIFKIQMFFLIHFTNVAAQNSAKQRMTKYHPQKSQTNNARSVVKSLPPPP